MSHLASKNTNGSYCSVDDDFKEEEVRSLPEPNNNTFPTGNRSRSSRNCVLDIPSRPNPLNTHPATSISNLLPIAANPSSISSSSLPRRDSISNQATRRINQITFFPPVNPPNSTNNSNTNNTNNSHNTNANDRNTSNNRNNVNSNPLPISTRGDHLQWFQINDKLDILHEKEWYRGEITQVDGYSIGVHFDHSNGRTFKWIKDCNHIFRVICQCTKQCHSHCHLIAPYGSQTNFSYDEQIDVSNVHCLRFHAVIHSVLLKYITCNIRDAAESTQSFKVDEQFKHSMEQTLTRCGTMTQLLDQHRQFQTRMNSEFERAAQRQDNVATNTVTIGQYIRYIEKCDATKLKHAVTRQEEGIQEIDAAISKNQRQIEKLLEQQRQLKAKREVMTQRKRTLMEIKVRNEGTMSRLTRRHRDCEDAMKQSKRELMALLDRHQSILRGFQRTKRNEFERGYREWDKEDTVSWIMMIDDHRFSTVHKYSKFRKMLNKSGINGETLHELKSELFLKYVKLGVASRTALIENINRLLSGRGESPSISATGFFVNTGNDRSRLSAAGMDGIEEAEEEEEEVDGDTQMMSMHNTMRSLNTVHNKSSSETSDERDRGGVGAVNYTNKEDDDMMHEDQDQDSNLP